MIDVSDHVYDLSYFDFDRKGRMLHVYSEVFGGSFPTKIVVKSHHTGRVIIFVKDTQAALANEFWDGERCEYVPQTPLPNVERLIVEHAT